MNVLAIDTSTDRLSIAAARSDGAVAVREATGARRHAGLLGPLVNEALGDLGLGLEDIGRILVADGPGSFTGLRVGAAWVKGVAAVRLTPVAIASTLLVRAATIQPGEPGRVIRVAGVGAALRGELFVAGYRLAADSVEQCLAPTVVAKGAPLPGGFDPEWIVGDVAPAEIGAWSWARHPQLIGPPEGLPNAADLLRLGRVPGGTVFLDDLGNWEPVYGRPAEAQARWEQEHGRPLADSARGA